MILLDTNVLIYASDPTSEMRQWARQTIASAVADDGAAINTVCLAELCVGDREPDQVAVRVRSWGVTIIDLPVAAAEPAARAYRAYRKRRREQSEQSAPNTPLPDFFIGAHAQMLQCPLATADRGRFATYFPSVSLITPRTELSE